MNGSGARVFFRPGRGQKAARGFVVKNCQTDRPKWFAIVRGILKVFLRRPRFVFTGKNFQDADEPFLLLSNHVGASAPLRYELYLDLPFRFWGTYELTNGLKSVCRYLADVYLYEKKHFPRFLAVPAAFVISPFVNLAYKGLCLIPTYPDLRFLRSLRESADTLSGGQNLVIFPEDSSDGYHDKLRSFLTGFVVLAHVLYVKGTDVRICCAYYRRKDRTVIVGQPVRFSELAKEGYDKYRIAGLLCGMTNDLASWKPDASEPKKD